MTQQAQLTDAAQSEPTPPKFLTCSAVARLIDRTPATVRLLVAQGRIRVATVTSSGERLFLAADVEAYLRQREARLTERTIA